jgi:hypothetical protein
METKNTREGWRWVLRIVTQLMISDRGLWSLTTIGCVVLCGVGGWAAASHAASTPDLDEMAKP